MPDPIYMDSFATATATANDLISDSEIIGQENTGSEFKPNKDKYSSSAATTSYPTPYSLSSRIRRRIY